MTERPILALLAQYETYLRSKGDGRKHIRGVSTLLFQAVRECRWQRPEDLAKLDRLRSWLMDERKRRNLAAGTINHRVTTLRSFASWLVREDHLDRNPLLALSRLNAAVDRRRERRPLSDREAFALLEAAASSPRAFRGLSGTDRAMAYAMALYTGLRAGELAGLTRAHLDLGGPAPVLRVRAVLSKSKRENHLPIYRELAARLRPWLVGRGHGNLWPGGWWRHSAMMLRMDLAPAGIPYRDALGRYADFHALRHTFLTNLARAGVHPRTAQVLARHSNVSITLNVYTHVDLSEARDALEKLPTLLPLVPRPG